MYVILDHYKLGMDIITGYFEKKEDAEEFIFYKQLLGHYNYDMKEVDKLDSINITRTVYVEVDFAVILEKFENTEENKYPFAIKKISFQKSSNYSKIQRLMQENLDKEYWPGSKDQWQDKFYFIHDCDDKEYKPCDIMKQIEIDANNRLRKKYETSVPFQKRIQNAVLTYKKRKQILNRKISVFETEQDVKKFYS